MQLIGPLLLNRLPNSLTHTRLPGQGSGRGDMRCQPVLKDLFGLGYRRGDWPKRVIQIDGDGPDFLEVEHDRRE
jgi:hypothetical protein